jgi:transcriptional regulator NrdR family protein
MTSWHECEIQVIPLAKCPFCDTTERPILVRSSRADDGSSWQRCVCRQCSQRFLRVLTTEDFLPKSGKVTK